MPTFDVLEEARRAGKVLARKGRRQRRGSVLTLIGRHNLKVVPRVGAAAIVGTTVDRLPRYEREGVAVRLILGLDEPFYFVDETRARVAGIKALAAMKGVSRAAAARRVTATLADPLQKPSTAEQRVRYWVGQIDALGLGVPRPTAVEELLILERSLGA